MGRGDKKTKKGKIAIGSYGVSRPRAIEKITPAKAVVKAVKSKAKSEEAPKAKAAAPKAKAKSKSKDSE